MQKKYLAIIFCLEKFRFEKNSVTSNHKPLISSHEKYMNKVTQRLQTKSTKYNFVVKYLLSEKLYFTNYL